MIYKQKRRDYFPSVYLLPLVDLRSRDLMSRRPPLIYNRADKQRGQYSLHHYYFFGDTTTHARMKTIR